MVISCNLAVGVAKTTIQVFRNVIAILAQRILVGTSLNIIATYLLTKLPIYYNCYFWHGC